MNKIIFNLFLLASINAYALPDCPNDQSVKWHNCFGSFYYENLDVYVGEFKDGKRNGQGTYTWANDPYKGDKYVGEYKDDKRNGQGTETYANGAKYVGEYKDDKKNGQGTHTWPSGQKYVGEFKDGKKNGRGIYYLPDGRKLDGYFKDDRYIPHICKELTISIYNPEYLKCINELIKEVTGEDSFLKLLDYIDEKN
tara:strand:- start:727 stop:1314 length:588 start_codon:yes stop_codon:yes gene_type:complete